MTDKQAANNKEVTLKLALYLANNRLPNSNSQIVAETGLTLDDMFLLPWAEQCIRKANDSEEPLPLADKIKNYLDWLYHK